VGIGPGTNMTTCRWLVLSPVRTYWAIVYSSFSCFSEHLNYYSFSTFVRGLLSNVSKDYLYDFQLKPRLFSRI